MKTVAVVPAKSPSQAKSRLAGVMTPQQRAALARYMLSHVLDTIGRARGISEIAVISPDTRLPLPESTVLIEQTRTGLNSLLEQGREWAIERGADALLVIFADLPLVSPEEIESMLELGARENTVVLAPDRHRTGTNAMLAHPPSLAHFAFGENSYARHKALAREAGATLVEYVSEGTSFDVDTPEDLRLIENKQPEAGSRVA